MLCQTTGDNPLTEPFAQQIGREILARLVDEARAAERALLEHFVNVRRRSRGPIVAISERNMLTNAAAARLIGDDDQSALWLWADRMLTGQQSSGCVELAGGQTVAARCEAVLDGEETVGALIHFEVRHRQRSSRSGAGWKSLSAAELGVAELVAGGLTNQEAGARLFLSRYTIDFHLRQIYNKLGVRSRVELTRMVIETRARQPLVA